jgi:hypothetical protein
MRGDHMEQKEVHEDVLRGRILNIALGTRVQVQLAGMDGQFKSSMVGMQPGQFLILQLRQSKRVDCFFPGRAKIQGKEHQGSVVDISTGGCRFSIDTSGEVRVAQMEVGETIDVSFQLSGSSEPQTALGKVRSISRDPMKVIVGIQFDALDAETVNSIEALIGSFWLSDDHHFGLG